MLFFTIVNVPSRLYKSGQGQMYWMGMNTVLALKYPNTAASLPLTQQRPCQLLSIKAFTSVSWCKSAHCYQLFGMENNVQYSTVTRYRLSSPVLTSRLLSSQNSTCFQPHKISNSNSFSSLTKPSITSPPATSETYSNITLCKAQYKHCNMHY